MAHFGRIKFRALFTLALIIIMVLLVGTSARKVIIDNNSHLLRKLLQYPDPHGPFGPHDGGQNPPIVHETPRQAAIAIQNANIIARRGYQVLQHNENFLPHQGNIGQ